MFEDPGLHSEGGAVLPQRVGLNQGQVLVGTTRRGAGFAGLSLMFVAPWRAIGWSGVFLFGVSTKRFLSKAGHRTAAWPRGRSPEASFGELAHRAGGGSTSTQ